MKAFNNSASLNVFSPIVPTQSNGLKNTGQSKALRILCNKKAVTQNYKLLISIEHPRQHKTFCRHSYSTIEDKHV